MQILNKSKLINLIQNKKGKRQKENLKFKLPYKKMFFLELDMTIFNAKYSMFNYLRLP
jgi:hypothetical protein